MEYPDSPGNLEIAWNPEQPCHTNCREGLWYRAPLQKSWTERSQGSGTAGSLLSHSIAPMSREGSRKRPNESNNTRERAGGESLLGSFYVQCNQEVKNDYVSEQTTRTPG